MLSKKLTNSIIRYLDNGEYQKVRKLIYGNIEKFSLSKFNSSFFKTTQLYGYLIDLGNESKHETDLNNAISFLESNEIKLFSIVDKQSYYYNLANAKHGIARIHIEKHRGVPSLKIISSKLQAPISLYWTAYKLIKGNDSNDLRNQILINLSNSLIDSGRIIECVQFLDSVLEENPDYPQALISRGDAIHHLSLTTNCAYTVSLFYEIYKSYYNGIRTGKLPSNLLERCIRNCQDAKKKIESYGFQISEKEDIETEKEFQKHSIYRKFSITNKITLNEHAIYCKCNSAKYDDLQIGVQHASFSGNMVPKMELLLNRVKSEFSLARLLLFQSMSKNEKDNSSKFSELLDGELINIEIEKLRTSYRICYGILDKIALGICKFYKLSKDGEPIYFERFWNPGKSSDRWEKLNSIKNIHLSALYCIACDLNTTTGELKHFKDWRNKLEHKVLILKEETHEQDNIMQLFNDKDFISVAELNDFRDKTLHLLQLTRAAIFSFVYCIRLETIQHPSLNQKGYKIDFKK